MAGSPEVKSQRLEIHIDSAVLADGTTHHETDMLSNAGRQGGQARTEYKPRQDIARRVGRSELKGRSGKRSKRAVPGGVNFATKRREPQKLY